MSDSQWDLAVLVQLIGVKFPKDNLQIRKCVMAGFISCNFN